MRSKVFRLFALVLILTMIASPVGAQPISGAPTQASSQVEYGPSTADTPASQEAKASNRLIIELQSPPLTQYAKANLPSLLANGKLDTKSATAQAYIERLRSEQAAFVANMQQALPGATVDYYINESQNQVPLTYQITYNGLTINPGATSREVARKALSQLPGVKGVFYDYAHDPDLYASVPLINAAAAWNNPVIGGMANAGAGVKVASMDGGVHKDAPMFDGTGYSYPPDYPVGGLGLTANNNGKIIASRVYFRSWDPPSAGDENPWPGTQGTSHGVHTASIAAGEEVVASYLGVTETLSGVAPNAWVMSYRVFYNSITNDGSFYNAEGIAALEDIVKDGADVLNNSWGGGPGSIGGEYDPLDQALINVANAGTFVSMSAGNAGPNNGTTDHPSDEYIDVAASSTDATLASGRVSVTAPTPVPANLMDMSYGTAEFGAPLPIGTTVSYTFVTAAAIEPANVTGCSAFTGTPFTGNAALISRGSCDFSLKVYNAQQAGADFAIIYNNAGDSLINMAAGTNASLVTIPSIFVGQTNGTNMVTWYGTNGSASELELSTVAFQAGNTPDVIASFSSRGPGVGNVLKPDITAPGVNILAQGFTPGVSGEARHLGWGQASGTSMAAPHVAGAAALIRQIHPDWTNAEIKSAMMSTSKYLGIWNGDGSHAQPLDMGAGRLDLTNAADPGVILDPPSLSFGQLMTGTMKTINVTVTSVYTASETYDLSLISVGGTYSTPITSTLPAFSVSPSSISLAAGASATVAVTFDSSLGSIGDNQGYLVMDGSVHDAHMPAWARVYEPAGADVLIIDNDASSSLSLPDYAGYYTSTLTNLGFTYAVLDTDNLAGGVSNFLPEAAVLSGYKAIIYFTGDNWYPNGYFTVPTPLTAQDMDRLTEYANNGGVVFAMGQDMASVLNSTSSSSASFFYSSVLGGAYLQDSVTGVSLPSQPVTARPDAPVDFSSLALNLGGPDTHMVTLTGANETPPVATTTQGTATFAFNNVTNELDYDVTVMADTPITVTASHIHTGTIGVAGPVLYPLYTPVTPTLVTDTLSFDGSVILTDPEVTALMSGGLYINVHTTAHPAGEIRAQLDAAVNGDGAANQVFIDEIKTYPNQEPDSGVNTYPYQALLQYPGPNNVEDGTVAMAHRDQPNLDNPGLAYLGRSIYTTFGLEGVNNGTGTSSRENLLTAFMNWAMDEPTAAIMDVTPSNESDLTMFEATLTSNITGTVGTTYRWDFGDGSSYTPAYKSSTAGHNYAICGTYTVRVEATDSLGNTAIGEQTVKVTNCATWPTYLPLVFGP